MKIILLALIVTLCLSLDILFRQVSPDLFTKLGLMIYCYYVKDYILTLTYSVFTRIYNVLDVLFIIAARIGNSISRVKKRLPIIKVEISPLFFKITCFLRVS
jgi:hypothetical protein